MVLGIDPKVDYAFKYLLGRESTRPILIDVLNQVLGLPSGHRISSIGTAEVYERVVRVVRWAGFVAILSTVR